MDLKLVKEFIKLAKDENVASLKYEKDDVKISVSLVSNAVSAPMHMAPTQAVSQVQTPSAPAPSSDPNVVEISSPFVGTFYRASAPGEPPFVKVGDKVSSGSTLCILEAMKIMNEIDSDVSGEVVEICVENESLVEFGQTLFKIRKS